MNTKFWCFNRFEIELPIDCVNECSHMGSCDSDVDYWFDILKLNLSAEDVKTELKEYGAWSEDELLDHTQNVKRIIWVASGNIKEEM